MEECQSSFPEALYSCHKISSEFFIQSLLKHNSHFKGDFREGLDDTSSSTSISFKGSQTVRVNLGSKMGFLRKILKQ
jgi:hypothetical protein